VLGEGSESCDQRVPPGGRRQSRSTQANRERRDPRSDVATAEGCVAALEQALTALGGLDVQANNAGAVRVGRRENTDEAELQAMIDATPAGGAQCSATAAMSRWRMFALS
jgi:NAD(P)-dependent dehydrogenase (short-subunit alcohol dehydrogenase family)